MTKKEALELGVPEENIKKFQELCSRDLQKAVDNRKRNAAIEEAETIRRSITSIVKMINRPENLQKVLKTAAHFYLKEWNVKSEVAKGTDI